MGEIFKYTVGDTYPPYKINVLDSNRDPYDLTGWTGTWKTRKIGETENHKSGSISITNYTSGVIEVQWGANDLDTAGDFRLEVELSSGSAIMQINRDEAGQELIIIVNAGI
jgi:hypothetical protein